MKLLPDRLPRALAVRSYEELARWLNGFADATFNLTFLVGRPGLGKSQLALRALEGRRHAWIDCHATKLAMYCRLYQFRNEPVVIDDENTVLADPGKLALMNALCQTNAERELRWDSAAKHLEERKVPAVFQTRSPVLVITNRLRNLNPQQAAMIDRGQPLLFQPTSAAIHKAVEDWFTDKEVHTFFGELLPAIPGLSMRDYVRARAVKTAGMDWRACLHRQWRTGKLARVLALRADLSFASEEDRVRAFVAGKNGSRATYFRCLQKLRELGIVTTDAECRDESPSPGV